MIGTVVLCVLFGAAAIGLAYPFVGLVISIWVDLAAPQAGFYSPISAIGISNIVAAFWIIGLLIGTRGKIRISAFTVLVFAYVFWFSVTTYFALYPEAAMTKFDRAIKGIIPVAICSLFLTSPKRREFLLLAYLFAVTVYGLRAAMSVLNSGGGYGVNLTGNSGSVLFESSTFSIALVGSTPILYHIYKHSILIPKRFRPSWLFIGIGLAFVIAVVGSYARSGLVAAAFMGVAIALFSKQRILAAILIVSLGSMTWALLPEEYVMRIMTITTYNEDASAMGRIGAWNYALDIASRMPTGGGFGAFKGNEVDGGARYVESHSWFFEALGEHGWFGAVLLCLIFINALISALRGFTQKKIVAQDPYLQSYCRSLFFALIALVSGGMFVGIASYTFTYVLPALATGVLLDVKRK